VSLFTELRLMQSSRANLYRTNSLNATRLSIIVYRPTVNTT